MYINQPLWLKSSKCTISQAIYFLEVIKNYKGCLKEAHFDLCSAYLIYWANFWLKLLLQID